MKSKNKNNKIISAASFIFILVFMFLLSQADISKTDAQTSTSKLSGYAWSDTIGWISFDSSTNGNNEVSIDTNGNLNGYAWSENVGWIKFGNLSNFPSSGTNAKLTGVNLTGWARACAGTENGDCNSVTRTDGWDGWIALSDPTGNEAYGVQFNNPQGNNPSFAWGSDVIGWIDFSGVTGQSLLVNGQCRTYPAGTPQLPSLPGDADLCISGTLSDLTETRITAFNQTVNNPYDYSYSWNCLGVSGGTDGLNCSVTTDIQRASGLGPITIGARLNPSIVNKGQTCQASIVESSNVLDLINASSTCEIYKASDLDTPIDQTKNPASASSDNWPNVEPGYDYKVVCKDNSTQAQTYTSKTLKCLLNPSVKEI
jgi:hypothetical protein